MNKVYEKENLEPIIKNSNTLTEVLLKLNLRIGGGNYRILKNYITKYSINISHFNPGKKRIDGLALYREKIYTPLSAILVENSTFNRTHLKNRLYKEGLKKRECELCGQGESWNGKKMSLILDHENGIHDDNKLTNLRIVCPNCNATLDTHGGKNMKKKIHIPQVDKRSLRRKVLNRPPLDQLKIEIKSLGYVGTGRKYGVSDNAIRKWENYIL